MALSDAVRTLKTNSSRWMRETDRFFAWQHGYEAFQRQPSPMSNELSSTSLIDPPIIDTRLSKSYWQYCRLQTSLLSRTMLLRKSCPAGTILLSPQRKLWVAGDFVFPSPFGATPMAHIPTAALKGSWSLVPVPPQLPLWAHQSLALSGWRGRAAGHRRGRTPQVRTREMRCGLGRRNPQVKFLVSVSHLFAKSRQRMGRRAGRKYPC